ncbi:hypothetical protein RJT34_27660 [Clitoria ternatea]|uniref:Uncharacterized protein n=1 Tax=Clitoria ternatea TaxID=43366 RepID=A0AAN9IB38_CLITE
MWPLAPGGVVTRCGGFVDGNGGDGCCDYDGNMECGVCERFGNDKNLFVGSITIGLHDFSKKRRAGNKWSLQKDGLRRH